MCKLNGMCEVFGFGICNLIQDGIGYITAEIDK